MREIKKIGLVEFFLKMSNCVMHLSKTITWDASFIFLFLFLNLFSFVVSIVDIWLKNERKKERIDNTNLFLYDWQKYCH